MRQEIKPAVAEKFQFELGGKSKFLAPFGIIGQSETGAKVLKQKNFIAILRYNITIFD